MVYEGTIELQSPLSFMTAPPNLDNLTRTRFREPRNLPYKDAPGFMASLYYWWWAFLNATPPTNAHAVRTEMADSGGFTKILEMCLEMTSCLGGEAINCSLQNAPKR